MWLFFFSMHCQKLYLVLRSKNAAICAYTDNSEKLLSGILPIRFSSVHCQKSAIYSYLSYKNAATSSYLFANRKKRHLSATLPCGFFPVRTVKNYTLFSGLKTPQSIQQILVNSQKNHTLSGSCLYVFFPSTLLKIICTTVTND